MPTPTSSSVPTGAYASSKPILVGSSATSGGQIADDDALQELFARDLNLARRVLAQDRHRHGRKVYSLHAPEVECIGKGKAHKPCELMAWTTPALRGSVILARCHPAERQGFSRAIATVAAPVGLNSRRAPKRSRSIRANSSGRRPSNKDSTDDNHDRSGMNNRSGGVRRPCSMSQPLQYKWPPRQRVHSEYSSLHNPRFAPQKPPPSDQRRRRAIQWAMALRILRIHSSTVSNLVQPTASIALRTIGQSPQNPRHQDRQ